MTTEMKRLEEFRCQFPLLESQVYGKPLVYFDNAATTQKPAKVIEASSHFYETQNANVHRASHAISAKATTAFEQSRTAVAQFINARSTKEVIWTSGTTNAINLVVQSWGKANLTKHDKVLVICWYCDFLRIHGLDTLYAQYGLYILYALYTLYGL